jgi:hypothetical protein
VRYPAIANLAAGISKEKLSHDEVLETGKKSGRQFRAIVVSILQLVRQTLEPIRIDQSLTRRKYT